MQDAISSNGYSNRIEGNLMNLNKLRILVMAIMAALASSAIAADAAKAGTNVSTPAAADIDSGKTPPKSIDKKTLQVNIDGKGLSTGTQNGGKGSKQQQMGLGGQPGSDPARGSLIGKSTAPGGAGAQLKKDIGTQGPIRGAKYGDTFGGQRMNRGQEGGGMQNFAGGGKGNTSNDIDLSKTPGSPGPNGIPYPSNDGGEGGGSNKMNKLPGYEYRQSTGDDAGHVSGVITGANTSKSGIKFPGQAESQNIKLRRERDDSMGSSTFTPVGRQDVITAERGIAGRTGGAGGKDDGRTDQQTTSGSTGGMVVGNRAEGAVREGGVSTINIDKALEINKTVNPTRQ
jgi:hypothetical protein